MNAQEFEKKYYEDGEIYGDDVTCVVNGDDVVEHKTVYNVDIYQVGEGESAEYFEVMFSRDNCGYWSDGERYDPEFRKVVPVKKVVEITEWEAVK